MPHQMDLLASSAGGPSVPNIPAAAHRDSGRPAPSNRPGELRRARFNGPDYDRGADQARLTGQILRVYEAMRGGAWRTLEELVQLAQAPAASVSAQLRHLRKPRFGGFTIEKRPRGDRAHGLWEYRLTP